MSLVLLLAAMQGVPVQIVVSGKRLDQAYTDCASGSCEPLKDAQISIAWAEKLFRNGDYRGAKRALGKAVSRNRRFAKVAPRPVAAIYEAYATVALQEGDTDVYRRAVAGQVQTLRDNLPDSDPAVLDTMLAIGDMWMKLGNAVNAERSYRSAEQRALSQEQPMISMMAAIRRIWLASLRGQTTQANEMVDRLAARAGPENIEIRRILPILKLRLALGHASDTEIDRLVKSVQQSGDSPQPMLVWAPAYEASPGAEARDTALKFGLVDPVAPASSDFGGLRWADIGFWIRPNGRTDAIDVIRGSAGLGWTKSIVTQISRRRYAPSTGGKMMQGAYRIERFTLRGAYGVPPGSFIRRRIGPPSLEVLDLTSPASQQPQR
ncbi:hypothetical protein HL653_14905 [Sphingomonas sp. AP4-R1]|uniref:tetratricopeptide repeat protein n=1 Tax=Sphingomonas sp. AP4-R1 TaxID=2735134 RepID=UPI001493AA0A|nr:hypothetical protein [Sphingomonas sp. AP4-R1]QJU58886.1 hypothetical protein HL653_14905 [Sphingomonas sp. AP4-R1]